MKITDLKSYSEYCNYLINNYGRSYNKNREIEDNGLLKEKSINCNGEPWSSFSKEELFAILFNFFLEQKRQEIEYRYQRDLSYGELIFEFRQEYKNF